MGNSRVDWASVGQLILALVGASFQLGLALMMLIFGAIQLSAMGAPESTLYGFMPGISMAAVGILILPSAYYSLMRVLGKKPVDSKMILGRLHPGWWILALPLVLLMGNFVAKTPLVTWLLPPLQVLAIGIPSIWMLYLAIRRLPTGSSQRLWGVYNAGLFLAPALIIVFELIAGLGLFFIGVLYVSTNPGMMEKLTVLAEQLRSPGSQEEILKILGPFLVHPLAILGLLGFAAFAVPLIEELVKPIGVWLLAGRKMTPAAGFAAGAISGAGYGLAESLMFNAASQDWMTLVLARNGTTAIHILTAAMMGWALVQTWQKKRFLRVGFVYLLAVLIHGAWNSMTLILGFRSLAEAENLTIRLPLIAPLGSIAVYVLGLIAASCFIGLFLANRALQKGTAINVPLKSDEISSVSSS